MQYTGWVVGSTKNLSPKRETGSADFWPWADDFFNAVEWFCGIMFTVEIGLKFAALRLRVFRDPWNWVDMAVVA
eukprot:CAMPEP_0175238346 /NCGR_PEP_ID=MMETSP0093-20121207/28989_1 /TAXON_ID=311494 /ORGANISM="Alexandrium monilatum, Strain CCMP3105" /LENGTH=73 /DNA_ID=CAMNT_0016532355 /DNA_START=102 /DNA_END=320 /DNA_ORIENTATION=-